VVNFKDNIISLLRQRMTQFMSDEWEMAEDIYKRIVTITDEKTDDWLDFVSLEKVGNNLRILKKMGSVEDSIINGRKYWRLIKKFDHNPPVKMVVAIPKDLHNKITKIANKDQISKVSVIINILNSKLNT